MCSFRILLAYLTINGSITFIQGQGQSKSKNNLVIYDPNSGRQTSPVGGGTSSKDGVSLVNLPIYWTPCTCAQWQCNCCIGIRLQSGNIDKKVCVQVTFVLATMKLNIVIKLEARVLLNVWVSVLNPPAICMPIFLPVPVFLCFKIYDIVLPIGSDFEGCFLLLLRLVAATLYELKLGCVRLGAGGVGFFRQSLVEDDREDITPWDNDGFGNERSKW